MIDRRTILGGTAAAVAAGILPRMAGASAGSLRIASLKFGSLSWLLDTIKAEGLDQKAGLRLDIIEVATNQAGPVALLSGDADVIVSDWTWAMRQRALGEKVKFSPYSSALGAVMVPKASGIKSVGDLTGKRLGVAGSAIDKSWLLLRAYSRKTLGKDVADIASLNFGAAPLLTEELRNGRLDAVLNFWTYSARLAGQGYVQLLSMADVLKDLGVAPVPPLVGFVWRERTEAEKGAQIAALMGAVHEGLAVLATSDAAWERLRPLVRPANDAELAAIRTFYRSGIPGPWTDAETQSAEKLMGLLIELGDKELVGNATRFDAELFRTAS